MAYKFRKILYSFLCSGLFISCGYYSFKGSLPSYLRTIAIPVFVDRSAYPGVLEKVTDSITNAFINDNTLKLVDESKADVILNGTIQSVTQKVAAVKAGETVSEYQMYVSVKVVCEDIKQSKKMYEKVFSQYGIMSSDAGQDEKDKAIDDAIELITEDVLNTTLGGW
jgi:polyribonucleotide nucleotidyltransferase